MREFSQLVRTGLHACQVCVPASFSKEQVFAFANRQAPIAAPRGWQRLLQGGEEGVPCAVRPGFVHFALVANS